MCGSSDFLLVTSVMSITSGPHGRTALSLLTKLNGRSFRIIYCIYFFFLYCLYVLFTCLYIVYHCHFLLYIFNAWIRKINTIQYNTIQYNTIQYRYVSLPCISVRDEFRSGGGGGGLQSLARIYIFSTACMEIKWFCPNITRFPPPPPRKWLFEKF